MMREILMKLGRESGIVEAVRTQEPYFRWSGRLQHLLQIWRVLTCNDQRVQVRLDGMTKIAHSIREIILGKTEVQPFEGSEHGDLDVPGTARSLGSTASGLSREKDTDASPRYPLVVPLRDSRYNSAGSAGSVSVNPSTPTQPSAPVSWTYATPQYLQRLRTALNDSQEALMAVDNLFTGFHTAQSEEIQFKSLQLPGDMTPRGGPVKAADLASHLRKAFESHVKDLAPENPHLSISDGDELPLLPDSFLALPDRPVSAVSTPTGKLTKTVSIATPTGRLEAARAPTAKASPRLAAARQLHCDVSLWLARAAQTLAEENGSVPTLRELAFVKVLSTIMGRRPSASSLTASSEQDISSPSPRVSFDSLPRDRSRSIQLPRPESFVMSDRDRVMSPSTVSIGSIASRKQSDPFVSSRSKISLLRNGSAKSELSETSSKSSSQSPGTESPTIRTTPSLESAFMVRLRSISEVRPVNDYDRTFLPSAVPRHGSRDDTSPPSLTPLTSANISPNRSPAHSPAASPRLITAPTLESMRSLSQKLNLPPPAAQIRDKLEQISSTNSPRSLDGAVDYRRFSAQTEFHISRRGSVSQIGSNAMASDGRPAAPFDSELAVLSEKPTAGEKLAQWFMKEALRRGQLTDSVLIGFVKHITLYHHAQSTVIRKLCLKNSIHVNSQTIYDVIRLLPYLYSADFRGCIQVDDSAMVALSQCRYFSALKIDSSCFGIHRTSLRMIGEWWKPTLRKIVLSNHADLRSLADCQELKHVDISGCTDVSSVALCELVSRLPHLEVLRVADCCADDLFVATAARCQLLSRLDLKGCQLLTVMSLQYLKNIAGLVSLSLSGLDYEDTDKWLLQIVQRNENLEELYISDSSRICDPVIQALMRSCKRLHTLELQNCRLLSDLSLLAISQFGGATLRSLELSNLPLISVEGLLEISLTCTQLTSLDVNSCNAVTNSVVFSVAANLSCLQTLRFSQCTHVGSLGVLALARFLSKTLTSLDMGSCNVSDSSVELLLLCCSRLDEIHLRRCPDLTDVSRQAARARNCRFDMPPTRPNSSASNRSLPLLQERTRSSSLQRPPTHRSAPYPPSPSSPL